jgi:hypothetical protein
MALKSTSSPIAISTNMPLTVPVGGLSSATKTIDLQLNPLDNEVFVVTAVKIDFLDLPDVDASAAFEGGTFLQASVLKNQPPVGEIQTIANSNCVASSKVNIYIQYDLTTTTVLQYTVLENTAMDTPPASQDYLDIIATDNFVVQFSCGEALASQQVAAAIRVYGYRARADAATYAALVQSEVLSS